MLGSNNPSILESIQPLSHPHMKVIGTMQGASYPNIAIKEMSCYPLHLIYEIHLKYHFGIISLIWLNFLFILQLINSIF